jgi:outer membrane lipoprotein SlyB
LLIRLFAAATLVAPLLVTLSGCGQSYSPDTYASNAAQQAAKVESGVIAGVRPVKISAQGTVGGVTGAAAGGAAGSQIGSSAAGTFGAIGGSLIGGITGVATEHLVGDTNGFEYIVRKANGEMTAVTQKDEKPLRVGQKVLVIAGPQARIIPDYTVPFDNSPKPPAGAQPAAGGVLAPVLPVTPQLPATVTPSTEPAPKP